MSEWETKGRLAGEKVGDAIGRFIAVTIVGLGAIGSFAAAICAGVITLPCFFLFEALGLTALADAVVQPFIMITHVVSASLKVLTGHGE